MSPTQTTSDIDKLKIQRIAIEVFDNQEASNTDRTFSGTVWLDKIYFYELFNWHHTQCPDVTYFTLDGITCPNDFP